MVSAVVQVASDLLKSSFAIVIVDMIEEFFSSITIQWVYSVATCNVFDDFIDCRI